MYGNRVNILSNVAEQLLTNNLTQKYDQLCDLMDGTEQMPIEPTKMEKTVCDAVAELQHNLADFNFDENAPEFDSYSYAGLFRYNPLSAAAVRAQQRADSDKQENANGLIQSQPLYARQKLAQWVTNEKIEQELRSMGLHTDGREQSDVIRLMNTFHSMHEHLSAVLPSKMLNALPSDFPYDLPRESRATMPKSCNMRHHVQVLITKTERFLAAQHRTLESNKNLDYLKYKECSKKLKEALACLQCIKPFTTSELHHHDGEFINNTAKKNAANLETALLKLRDSLQAAYLFVAVFNWAMDNEYRHSQSMTEARNDVLNRAMNIVEYEKQIAAYPKQRSLEEQSMAERFQLDNVLKCAEEHEDFLNALLQSPEQYFRPELLAIFEPSFKAAAVPEFESITSEADTLVWHILDVPSSPPRDKNRSHFPLINRG